MADVDMYTTRNFAAPSLPLSPSQFDRQYQDQLNNVLRLYFNQIQATLGQLSVNTNYLVADLPSAVDSGSGARAFVSDATGPTFGNVVVGGGAVKTPVYSDGTNWRVG
jgi:hypothetical protein